MKTNLLILYLTGLLIISATAHAQVPVLSSYPGAQATLFLDFDGHTVKATGWNWGGPIIAQPAALNSVAITEIFHRVAEDYRPFNINVTTDSTLYLAAPLKRRMRIIVTPTSQWYGSAGGVAFVGSFTSGDDTPAWVFSSLLGNNPKVVAEAISHEAGHTLGLQHQSDYNATCQKTAEYSAGVGTGEIGWAPIMGNSYTKNLTTWHNGTSAIGCSYFQNDIEIIASPFNGFGFRSDDHSNTLSEATPIIMEDFDFLVNGMVNTTGDRDAFKLEIPYKSNFTLSAIPENVGSGNNGANVDIRVKILNSQEDTIGVYNPSSLLSAGIDTALNKGTYYVLVDGVGNANKSAYGSLGYYYMTGSLATVLPVHRFQLKGTASGQDHSLSWSFYADEPLKHIVVESSADGENFRELATLNTGAINFNYRSTGAINWYRLKAITRADERAFYSNIINLRTSEKGKAVYQIATSLKGQLKLGSNGSYPFRLFDATGKILVSGRLSNGINSLDLPGGASGLLLLRLGEGQEQWTEKLILP